MTELPRLDDFIDEKLEKLARSFIDGALRGLKDGREQRTFPVVPSRLPPRKIYKYFEWNDEEFEHLVDSLICRRTIRFSRASTLNDPFENSPSFSRLIDPIYIEKYGSVRNIRKILFQMCLKRPVTYPQGMLLVPLVPWLAGRVHKRVPHFVSKLEKLYIRSPEQGSLQNYDPHLSCFGEDGLLPLMWAHYARSHRGMVIEYDANNSYFLCEKFTTRLAPVRYSAKRPVFGVSPSFSVDYSRVKSDDWSYEREWRCLPQDQNRNSDDDFVFEGVEKSCISSVILGLRIKEDQKVHLINSIQADLPDTEIRHVVMDENEFALTTKTI